MLDAAAWVGVDNENFIGQGGDNFVATLRGLLRWAGRAVLKRRKEQQAAGINSAAPVSRQSNLLYRPRQADNDGLFSP